MTGSIYAQGSLLTILWVPYMVLGTEHGPTLSKEAHLEVEMAELPFFMGRAGAHDIFASGCAR